MNEHIYLNFCFSTKPLTIVYGDDWPDMAKFIDMFCPNVTYKFIKMKDPFGCHHS